MKLLNLITKLRADQATAISENEDLQNLIAQDALIKPVFIYPDDDSSTILRKLKREDLNVCIVVTKDKKFVGEISDEDIIRLFLYQVLNEPLTKTLNVGYRRQFLYHRAEELINKHRSTVRLDTPINKVIELVFKEGFHYIPILDGDGRVKGVVTPSSLIDLLQDG